jgi:recombination DNA repair RAD52 pathway protein
MRTSFICTIAATSVAVFAFAAAPTIAHAKTAKACEADWKAGKAEIQKSGKKKKDFMTQCRASDSAAKADTAPAATPAKPATAAKPATTTEGQPGRIAMIARERACGADWKADKAAGKTGDQKWPQYWSDCNKRKKAQGM